MKVKTNNNAPYSIVNLHKRAKETIDAGRELVTMREEKFKNNVELVDTLFTEKQAKVWRRLISDYFEIIVLHGAVRSGKSHIATWYLLYLIYSTKALADARGDSKPMFIVAAVTATTLENNVIKPLLDLVGDDAISRDRFGRIMIYGVTLVTATTQRKDGAGRIQGLTSYGAIIDEVAVGHQDAIQEIIRRCSMPLHRIIMTSNPSYPTHYVKTNYIDRANHREIDPSTGKPYPYFECTFYLDDNPFVPESYKSMIRAEKSGVFRQRMVYGLWASAEGAIYSNYDKTTMYVDVPDKKAFDRYIIGVDWGWEHPGAIIVVGVNGYVEANNKATYTVVEEHVVPHRDVNDYWLPLAERLEREYTIDGYTPTFYLDYEDAQNCGIFMDVLDDAKHANKSVIPGVEFVSGTISKHNLYISDDCEHIHGEMYQYEWAKTEGDLKVRKTHDDALDALRYAMYTDYLACTNGEPHSATGSFTSKSIY